MLVLSSVFAVALVASWLMFSWYQLTLVGVVLGLPLVVLAYFAE